MGVRGLRCERYYYLESTIIIIFIKLSRVDDFRFDELPVTVVLMALCVTEVTQSKSRNALFFGLIDESDALFPFHHIGIVTNSLLELLKLIFRNHDGLFDSYYN